MRFCAGIRRMPIIIACLVITICGAIGFAALMHRLGYDEGAADGYKAGMYTVENLSTLRGAPPLLSGMPADWRTYVSEMANGRDYHTWDKNAQECDTEDPSDYLREETVRLNTGLPHEIPLAINCHPIRAKTP